MNEDKLNELYENIRVLKQKIKLKNKCINDETKINKDIKLLRRIFQFLSLSTLLLFLTNANEVIILLIYIISNAPVIYITYSETLSNKKLKVLKTEYKLLNTKLLLKDNELNKLLEKDNEFIENYIDNKQKVLIKK